MRVMYRRCAHCQIVYLFQASGNYWSLDTPEKYNDMKYCPDCKKAIMDALEKVPKKFTDELVITDDFTLDELLEIEKKRYKDHADKGLPCVRRCFVGLIDMEKGEYQQNGEVKTNDKTYQYSYWESDKKKAKVWVKKQKNLQTGEYTDWKDYG